MGYWGNLLAVNKRKFRNSVFGISPAVLIAAQRTLYDIYRTVGINHYTENIV